jgi:phosphoribosyl-dephospho-CoA transferase
MVPMSSLYKRHQLVWLSERGWREAAAEVPSASRHLPQRWQERDWPAVVRRHDADAMDDQVCIGIALPPDSEGIKLRLPLRVPVTQIREMRAPLPIGDVLMHAPVSWRSALQELHYKAMAQALDLRVYGSLALQALTGLTYLRAGSDIDMLFTPTNRFQLERGMQLLSHYAQVLPLDGEVLFPAGAVAWKEWLQASTDTGNRVLLKRADDVCLMTVAEVVAGAASTERLACPS